MAAMTPVAVPDIGDFEDVPIIELLVSEGDTVSEEDPLLTLESDKATMDVPSPVSGTVKEIQVAVGDKVSEGDALIVIETEESDDGEGDEGNEPVAADVDEPEQQADEKDDADGSAEPSDSAETADVDDASDPTPPAEDETQPQASSAPVYASPSVRKLAREKGVDLAKVAGSGRRGRITAQDVEQGESGEAPAKDADAGGESGSPLGDVKAGEDLGLAPWPTVDFAKFGDVERVPLTRIQKLSKAALARNWVRIPHVTHDDEADITELEAFRKQLNAEQDVVKVTMVALLLKACVASLKEFPRFNSALDGDDVVLRRYYNLGFAADTEEGLVVPVIKDVDEKGILQLAGELTELSGKAREGKLGPNDIAGATFSISSLGGIGGTSFTPIVNAPEVAILGVVRSAMKPVWDGEAFQPRLMLPLSLSYDHRVIDGAAAARFTAHLAGVLSDMRRVLL